MPTTSSSGNGQRTRRAEQRGRGRNGKLRLPACPLPHVRESDRVRGQSAPSNHAPRQGKSDPVDAENAARAGVSSEATGPTKARPGPSEQLRVLLVARGSAVKSRVQVELQLRCLVLELDDVKPAQVDRRHPADFTAACADLTETDGTSLLLRASARRWQYLDREARKPCHHRTNRPPPPPRLLTRPGIGPVIAAQLLAPAGDNPGRLGSEAAFAALCGVSPVERSSGKPSATDSLAAAVDRGHVSLVEDQVQAVDRDSQSGDDSFDPRPRCEIG